MYKAHCAKLTRFPFHYVLSLEASSHFLCWKFAHGSIAVGGFLPACFQERECYVSVFGSVV
jgi:hypothetical protein